jgi:hypothetical protein
MAGGRGFGCGRQWRGPGTQKVRRNITCALLVTPPLPGRPNTATTPEISREAASGSREQEGKTPAGFRNRSRIVEAEERCAKVGRSARAR